MRGTKGFGDVFEHVADEFGFEFMDMTICLGDLGDEGNKDTELRVGDTLIVDIHTLELSLGVVLTLKTFVTVKDPSKDQKEEDKGKNGAHKSPVKV